MRFLIIFHRSTSSLRETIHVLLCRTSIACICIDLPQVAMSGCAGMLVTFGLPTIPLPPCLIPSVLSSCFSRPICQLHILYQKLNSRMSHDTNLLTPLFVVTLTLLHPLLLTRIMWIQPPLRTVHDQDYYVSPDRMHTDFQDAPHFLTHIDPNTPSSTNTPFPPT